MPRLPYEKWLAYLLAAGLSGDEASAHVMDKGFIAPTPEQLASIPAMLGPSGGQVNVARWRLAASELGILSMFLDTKDVQRAKTILDRGRVRRVVEHLLLADVSELDICIYAEKLVSAKLTERSVAFYRHYFWNTETMPFQDWLAYFEALGKAGHAYRESLTLGPDKVLWKLGQLPNIDKSKAYSDMYHEAYMRYMELNGRYNNQDTAMAAKMWSEIAFKASEQLDQPADQVRQMTENLREVTLRFGRRDISSIDSLERPEK